LAAKAEAEAAASPLAAAAKEAAEWRAVATFFADWRLDREAEEAAEAAKAAKAKAEAAAEAEAEAAEEAHGQEDQRRQTALERALEEKVWGTLPYITDADFARYLDGQLPIEATERAFGDMEFFIWTRGIATYKLNRQSSAKKGCFVEEISGGHNPCFLRPFPIDLHSKEGLAAFAAGKPLPHPSYNFQEEEQAAMKIEAKRSWWSRLFLCGTVAVEK
jgi:hypothetical protein